MNALEIKNLSKSYNGFTLDNISLTLPSGCIMGLVGENGAGKSTIIKLILDMVKRDSGTITVLGKDNRDNPAIMKEDLGIVLDNTGFSGCFTIHQIKNILKHTYKKWNEEYFNALVKKLALPDNKPFKEFSKGMKMKLFIAAALSHEPKLLILDEATNGLDPLVRDEVTDIFSEFTRDENHSVLISSHIVSDLEKICDYIAFIHKGKLMLCEEKDILKERYCVVHCKSELLDDFPENSIKGRRITEYGAEVIAERELVPRGLDVSPIDIEQLFVFMAKEDL